MLAQRPLDAGSGSGPVRLDRRGSFMLHEPGGEILALRSRKSRAIVAYLAHHLGEHISRHRLLDLLWGDRGEAQARGSLRQAIFEINHASPGLVGSDREHLWIEPDRLSAADDQSAGVGEMFEDLDSITAEFDEWLRLIRSEAALDEWSELHRHAESCLAAGDLLGAMHAAERMRQIDPYNEDWLRLAMRVDFEAGHPASIQARFREMAQSLKSDLGVGFSAQTCALKDELLGRLLCRSDTQPPAAQAFIPPPAAAEPQRRGAMRAPWIAFVSVAALVAVVGGPQAGESRVSEVPRVAVLPFRAMSGTDPVVADSLAEDVTATLSHQKGLQTIGRQSAWTFRNSPDDLRKIGRKLDADYVVEGSVRGGGPEAQVNVSLIDTRDASIRWSGKFSVRNGDVQPAERAASAAILGALGLSSSASPRNADPRAYALYVRAKGLIRERHWAKIHEARDLLRMAVRIDPQLAPAWAQLAAANQFIGHDGVAGSGNNWRKEALYSARRALAIDPKLAEGHSTLAFVLGLDSDKGRAHLQHALKLDPRNPQTLYWMSGLAGQAGNHRLRIAYASKALEFDPVWRRPAEVIATDMLFSGRRDDAYRLVERIRAADPEAALEVAIALAKAEGDLSRAVQLGTAKRNSAAVDMTVTSYTVAAALNELGFVRESLIFSKADVFERSVHLRRLPSRSAILSATGEFTGVDSEVWMYWSLVTELARTNRYADIVALADRPNSAFQRLKSSEPFGREARAMMAAPIGLALAKVGRRDEAARLFFLADEAVRTMAGSGERRPEVLAEFAAAQAIMGRKEQALAFLGKAVATGWFAFDNMNYRLREIPWYSSLRGDPRFERLARITDARRERERREIQALGLI